LQAFVRFPALHSIKRTSRLHFSPPLTWRLNFDASQSVFSFPS